jgi:putative DNA primase/helicase
MTANEEHLTSDFPHGTDGTDGTASNDKASNGSTAESADGTHGTGLLQEAHNPEPERPAFRVYDHAAKTMDDGFAPGVWWHGTREHKGESLPHDKWICSPLHVEAVTSSDGADFGRLLHFRNTLGDWRKWAMPMHLLKGSGEDLRGELLNMGVEIDPNAFKLLNRYIQGQHPKRHVIAATATGWHSPTLFIMPRQNIGQGDAIYQNEAANFDDFRQAGTLEGWQQEIGARCAGNPLLMLGICAALAGPLLYHLQRQGGGFHIVGDSSTGKSSAIQAAASVWGHGEQFKRTWRATGNGLEGIAAQRNDTLLALDEIGEADPREIGAVIYALANGTGKARAGRTGAARATKRWRVVLFSSGELGLSAHMAEGGKRSRAGQEIRLLDIPARRAFGAWDDLHKLPGGREFSDAIQRASVTHYGHAGPLFIRQLVECGKAGELPDQLGQLVALYPDGSGQESRAAERFALLGLAGELAIEWGVLPLPAGSAHTAMLELFNVWRGSRGLGQSEDATICASLGDFLSRHGDALFSALGGDIVVRDRAGWWKTDGGNRIWLFTSEGLRRAVPGFDLPRILAALDAAGWITERSASAKSKKVKVDGRAIWLYHLAPADKTSPGLPPSPVPPVPSSENHMEPLEAPSLLVAPSVPSVPSGKHNIRNEHQKHPMVGVDRTRPTVSAEIVEPVEPAGSWEMTI